MFIGHNVKNMHRIKTILVYKIIYKRFPEIDSKTYTIGNVSCEYVRCSTYDEIPEGMILVNEISQFTFDT